MKNNVRVKALETRLVISKSEQEVGKIENSRAARKSYGEKIMVQKVLAENVYHA